MNVIIGCEFSGIVRDEFIRQGHNAISCDLIESERPGPHHVGDVLEFIDRKPRGYFDLMVAHPPCRFLSNSGALRLYINGKKSNGPDPWRWEEMKKAAEFFKALLNVPIEKIAAENPVMHGYAVEIIGKRHDQLIQPYNFGADASKATCLWLKNLRKLENGKYIAPRMVNGKPRWENQTDGGWNKLSPSESRSADRARTYPGVAFAMVTYWGKS